MSLKKMSLEEATRLGFDEPTTVVKLPDPKR